MTNHTPEVDARDGDRLVATGAVLLDVREPHEWVAGHAPAAVHVPLGALPTTATDGWSGRRVVVICRSGNRSRTATEHLLARGIDAVNLAGGMRAWHAAGLPVVTSTGDAGHVA